MDLFRCEKLFAAGTRNAVDRKTGRCPFTKVRRELPEEHDVARAVFFGSVERGGTCRRVSKGGGGVRHLPGKTVGGFSISQRLIPACLLPHRGLVIGAIMGGAFAWTCRVCGPRSITGRGRGLPTGPP